MKKYVIISIIFIIIFTSFSIGITAFLILNKKPLNNDSDFSIQPPPSPEVINQKTANLNETYNLNDIKITEYTEKIEGNEINYIQIDGLKDEAVEISINYILKNDPKSKFLEILSSDNYNGELYCYYNISGNFANVFSMHYYIDYQIKDDSFNSINICENFDLTTGNKLKLNDIIIDTPKTRQTLSNKLYPHVINAISDIEYDEEVWDLKVSNYNDIEEEIFKLINHFSTGKDINFIFNENSITFLDYDHGSINYINLLDCLTIYDKFNNQDIFDGKYKNMKNIPVLVKREYAQYQVVEKGSNYYLDVSLFDDIFSNEVISGETSKPVNFVKEQIQELKNIASQNPDTFYVFNNSYRLVAESHFDDLTEDLLIENYAIHKNAYIYETTKEFFESDMYPDILKINRGTLDDYEIWNISNLFAEYLYNYSANNNTSALYYYYQDSGEIELIEEYFNTY